jgi:hypothetical protein
MFLFSFHALHKMCGTRDRACGLLIAGGRRAGKAQGRGKGKDKGKSKGNSFFGDL